MRRRGSTSIAANPVLIGAATVLIVVVAVFLAYNANSGLPFVPTYTLKVAVPSAANLVEGNEVRIGGARVGAVDKITPVTHRDGSVTAQLELKLETTVRPLPRDSTVLIRPRSALGLKYVEITKGTSSKGLADGARLSLAHATPKAVEFDEVLGTFDDKTRTASQKNLAELGNALSGRGQSLNLAIGAFNPLVRTLVPVARNLAAPNTQLARLFQSLGQFAGELAPVSQSQAELFGNLDTTFKGLAAVSRPYLQDTISGGPAALDAGIQGFPKIRPFLANSQRLFVELRPGVRELRTAAPTLSSALQIGTGTLRRSTALSDRLTPTFNALDRFSTDPLVPVGLRDLTNTANALNPTLAFVKPAQTVCNYVSLFLRNVSSLSSLGDANGTGQRFSIVSTPQGPNNEGSPSSKPADGPFQDNYLHSNPLPNTAAPGQTQECEAGNEDYAVGHQVIGNAPGDQGTAHDDTGSGTATR